MKRTVMTLLLMATVALLLASGCGSKVSKANFDKISAGQTLAEVEAILGKGTESTGAQGAVGGLTGSAKVITWTDGDKSIVLTFVNDKVATKASKGL